MPLSPPILLKAKSDTKFHLLLQIDILRPSLDLTRNLGARQVSTSVDFEAIPFDI
jgi:hypothetical protein